MEHRHGQLLDVPRLHADHRQLGHCDGGPASIPTRMFDELKKDPTIGRAEAVRRAEMAMLDSANPPMFAHPLAWAPFVLAGEGGEGRGVNAPSRSRQINSRGADQGRPAASKGMLQDRFQSLPDHNYCY